MMPESRGRFAPSTTGRAHPGTLLAALLCWLDARRRRGEVLLRLEDLDRERTKPGFVDGLERDFESIGLDWDGVSRQSDQIERYEACLDALAAAGRIYACDCTRATIRASPVRAPDGSFRYSGACRERVVGGEAWRRTEGPLRIRLDDLDVAIRDESGIDLSGNPAALFGDPLVRRRDGAYAYHFTSVVDDEADSVNRIVRGRDLAPSTTLQVGLRMQLGYAIPSYRHHALLLESGGEVSPEGEGRVTTAKLSKFHGAVDLLELVKLHDVPTLVGMLASFVGLVPEGTRCLPQDLVSEFDWARVSTRDIALEWSTSRGLRRIKPD